MLVYSNENEKKPDLDFKALPLEVQEKVQSLNQELEDSLSRFEKMLISKFYLIIFEMVMIFFFFLKIGRRKPKIYLKRNNLKD